MKKIYYLSTCSTCQRIMKEVGVDDSWVQQDIKTEPITSKQLTEMKKKAGSYETLFSRRSMKYRPWGLHEMELGEQDYKKYILKEYTFLRRPVMIIGDQITVGNGKKEVARAMELIDNP